MCSMKNLGKLKLNALSEANLLDKEMNVLIGGIACGCGCHYADKGGSSIAGNRGANSYSGYESYGCSYYWQDGDIYSQCPTCSGD